MEVHLAAILLETSRQTLFCSYVLQINMWKNIFRHNHKKTQLRIQLWCFEHERTNMTKRWSYDYSANEEMALPAVHCFSPHSTICRRESQCVCQLQGPFSKVKEKARDGGCLGTCSGWLTCPPHPCPQPPPSCCLGENTAIHKLRYIYLIGELMNVKYEGTKNQTAICYFHHNFHDL